MSDEVSVLTGLVSEGVVDLDVALRLLRPRTLREAEDAQARMHEAAGTQREDQAFETTVDGVVGAFDSEGGPDFPYSERYALETVLGAGGMGSVWLAHDPVLGRAVAIKVRHAQQGEDPEGRFFFEARVTGGFAHPGIIPVYDAGTLPDGRPFYAMPQVEGRSLADVLGLGRAGAPEAWPLQRLLRTFARVCEAMAYAHDQGVIHRDLKPANILLGRYGEVYVADWGLSRGLAETERVRPGDATQDGSMLGTLHYMAPEQIDGQMSEIGPWSDVYSLGVLLFEILTLKLPFTGSSRINLMFQVARSPAPNPVEAAPEREVPAELAALCLEALAKDRAERPASDGSARIRRVSSGERSEAAWPQGGDGGGAPAINAAGRRTRPRADPGGRRRPG